MKLSDLQVISIVSLRLSGVSWPGVVRMMGLQEETGAQKLRRTVRDRLFPKATKKKKR